MRPEAPATSAPGAENPCYFTSGVVQGCRVTAISGNINGLKPSDFKGFSLKHSDISVYLEASPNLPLGASKFVLFAHCYAFCHHIHTGATALSKYVAQPHILNAGWVCWSFADLTWSIAKKKTTRADACGTISPSQKCGIKLNEIQNNSCFFGLRSRPKLKPKPRGTYHIGLEKVCCSERGALGFTWYRRRLKFIS